MKGNNKKTLAVAHKRFFVYCLCIKMELFLKEVLVFGDGEKRQNLENLLGATWQWAINSAHLESWPNVVTRRCKFSACVYLQLRLAWPCVHLRWLALTWAHVGRDQIFMQVYTSFSLFAHSTQVDASWEKSIKILLANEIQDMSALRWVL